MTKKTLIWITVLFVGLCAGQIMMAWQHTDSRANPSCLLLQQTATQQQAPVDTNSATAAATDANSAATAPVSRPVLQADQSVQYGANGGPHTTVQLGSVDNKKGYEYELTLDSRGAAINTARFTRYNDRDPKNPQPLSILNPAHNSGIKQDILSLASGHFYLPDAGQQLDLSQLNWQVGKPVQNANGQQSAQFTATITRDQKPALRLTKTYTVQPGTFMMDCSLQIENLIATPEKASFNFYGPSGLDKEGFRMDNRMVIAAYQSDQNQVTSSQITIGHLKKAFEKNDPAAQVLVPHKKNSGPLLWVGTVNKYFAGLIIPVDEANNVDSQWLQSERGLYFDTDPTLKNSKERDKGQGIGLALQSKPFTLAAATKPGSSQTFHTRIFLGPKDKRMFDKNDFYRRLGFLQTISFRSCCCPAAIISSLAFFILKIMNFLHVITHNYGIAIIILVAFMRLLLHPVTKKSQISMSKMSKLAPRAEEIKKKYANNKTEMQKRLMELYREQGASPITGMLPMFIQMPIWIALWSAVNSSIDLRGAAFLPFWITDLSSPDRLFSFFGYHLPILGSYFNLLPILMGVAFFLQQKLMPSQAATNPQMAQQQKMMMFMMPVLFPLMFYNMASGVNLYIMTSTFAGVVEQKIIRKHIQEREAEESKRLVAVTSKTGGKVKKRKPKPMFRDH